MYTEHDNRGRPHRSLDLKAPIPLGVPAGDGVVQRVDVLGGPIHEYTRTTDWHPTPLVCRTRRRRTRPLNSARILRSWIQLPVVITGGFSPIDHALIASPDWDILIVGPRRLTPWKHRQVAAGQVLRHPGR